MRGDRKGLGEYLYFEWLYPVKDYFKSTSKNELVFEMLMPLGISLITTIIYANNNLVAIAASKLAEILLTLTSILIGFSVMLVTLLLTSGGTGVEKLKEKEIEKKLYGKYVNLFQKLHIQFVNSLLSEIFLLMVVLLYYFLVGIVDAGPWQCVFLGIFIFVILYILLSILRGITNVYFSYYNSKE